MRRCIVTVQYDVTEYLPPDWFEYLEDDQIKAKVDENPEMLIEAPLHTPKGETSLVRTVDKIDDQPSEP